MLLMAKGDFVFIVSIDNTFKHVYIGWAIGKVKASKFLILLEKQSTNKNFCQYKCFANNVLGYINVYPIEENKTFTIIE